MPTIEDPTLTVDEVDGHPGERVVRVAYGLTCEATDALIGRAIVARIVVRAVDEHDAAVRPRQSPIVDAEETFVATAGTQHRVFEHTVNRVDLDVEQDWWYAGQSGEPEPIAEWVDHVAADIRLSAAGTAVAEATTPTVSASWGALGSD